MQSEPEAIAERLKLFRSAMGLSAAELCRQIDILPSAWSMYERGNRPFTLETATALRKKYGLSVDWVFFGEEACLPKRLFDLIQAERLKLQQSASK